MKGFFIFLILLAFVAGCAEEGVRVIRVNPNGSVDQTAPKIISPAPSSANQTQGSANSAVSNNTGTANTTTQTANTGTPTRADLALDSFFLSDLNVNQNENFDVKFKIKNSGTGPIGNFVYVLMIMLGSNVVKQGIYNYTQTISSGTTSSKITLTYSLADIGAYDIVVKLDPFGLFAEPNENNNEGTQRINVVAGNASAASGTSNPTSPENSGTMGNCTDSDSGKNYNVVGSCRDSQGTSISDICVDSNKMWEWYCDAGKCAYEEHTCVCRGGICV